MIVRRQHSEKTHHVTAGEKFPMLKLVGAIGGSVSVPPA